MNEERREAYRNLIQSLFYSPKDGRLAILEANIELLDDDFVEFIRDVDPKFLLRLDADEIEDIANLLYDLNIQISNLDQSFQAIYLEIAIACLDTGLICAGEAYSKRLALFQNRLGIEYENRIRGDKGDNLERAIKYYQEALSIYTRNAFSTNWAQTQNNLANAYSDRIRGDKGENLERAIKFYELALSVHTRETFPKTWAMTQYNLANVYRNRIKGDKGENLERAIKFYELALSVHTREAFPQYWAKIQYSLANTYSDRIRGDRGENIELAIAGYELALSVCTRDAFPEYWAETQNHLALAYSHRIRGDRRENFETAIAAYELALSVYTRDDFPHYWAMIHNNLGGIYENRIQGDRKENLETAIKFYELALSVHTREAFPQYWAETQNNLANAYSDRITGDRRDNLESAIKFYELALEVHTRKDFPEKWAMTQNNLAITYFYRITGDRGDNLERAIEFYEFALQVYTREPFPEYWARSQNNLANAYNDRRRGDRGKNIERAIELYQAALEVRTPTTLPLNCLITAQNLADLGFRESLWKTAIFGYEKAIEAIEQTREWVTSPTRKRQIIEENLNIYEKMMQSCINHQQYHKAVQTVERSKSRYLVELFTNSEIYPKTATESEKQQLRNLRSQIAASQQFLETETSSPTLSPTLSKGEPGGVSEDSDTQRPTQTRSLSPESFQQQTDKLATTLQQLEQLLKQIKQREPEFTLTQKVEPIDIAEFQKTLDTETAIVEWYIGNPKFNNQDWGGSAFIITRDKIDLVPITATELAELETWKNDYLNEYRDKAKQKIWQQTLSEKLHKLSEILRLNEIVAKIPNHCHQLILVPHRYLHLFPLHALPFTSQTRFSQKTKFRGNLLDCFPSGVKYAPSLQLLELVQNRLKTRTSPAPELQPLFAIQNPTEDLSNADMEVQIIKQKFDTHDILIKQQATKIAFNENLKNLSNASYIHFSCHGVFNFDYPLLSLLALADSIESIPEINPPQPPLGKGGLQEEINPSLGKGGLEERGLESPRYVTMRSGRKAIPEKCLTLREIFAELKINKCNLVTLSACETGLTSSTEMTDEYIGLPSGFLYAGSLSVVSTLWSVDDFATAILMIKFYQELLPKVSVAVALNCAQNWMRAVNREDFEVWVKSLNLDKKSGQSLELWLALSPEERPFSHPKYWAAFCATGY
jgi:CHAT domain-containing protein